MKKERKMREREKHLRRELILGKGCDMARSLKFFFCGGACGACRAEAVLP